MRESIPIQQRVSAGAATLDDWYSNWWQRIDLDNLRLEDGNCCVLGQLLGHYYLAPHYFGFADQPGVVTGQEEYHFHVWASKNGFNLSHRDGHEDWPQMLEAWKEEILFRLIHNDVYELAEVTA